MSVVTTLDPSGGPKVGGNVASEGMMKFLVLDSNAFIRGHGFDLYHKAERIVTCAEVLEEIRDAKAQDLLLRLPFTLEILSPSGEACREVADYAMKTGDFRSLSKTDLRLIALTYTLYLQEYGGIAPKRMKVLSDLAKAQKEKKVMKTIVPSTTGTVDFPAAPEEPQETAEGEGEVEEGVFNEDDVQVEEVSDDEMGAEEEVEDEGEAEQQAVTEGPIDGEDEGEGEGQEGDDYDDYEEESEEEEEPIIRAATEGVQGMDINVEDFPTLGAAGSVSASGSAGVTTTTFGWADMAKQPKNYVKPVIQKTEKPKPTPAVSAPVKPMTASKVIVKSEGFSTVGANNAWPGFSGEGGTTGANTDAKKERSLLSNQMQNENISRQMQAEDDGSGWISTTNFNEVNHFDVFSAKKSAASHNKVDKTNKDHKATTTTTTVSETTNNNIQKEKVITEEEEKEKAEKKRKKKEAQRQKKLLAKEQEQTTTTTVATTEQEVSVTQTIVKSNEKTIKKNKNHSSKNKDDEDGEDNEIDTTIRVACFTTDFAMQNVLLQLGLKVLASNGLFIRSARQWVLRCLGCHTIHTKDLHRMFCSQCGLYHLTRVAASIGENGKLRLHLKKNYRVDTSGMRYSLPSPGKQGRFKGEILLREDQLLAGIWRQKTVKINRDVKSAFGEDVTSEVGLHLNKLENEVFVGWGRSNPNSRKGRERRGKRRTTKY